MKCEKCGNEYPSQYYFATSTVCNECFKRMTPDEQDSLLKTSPSAFQLDELGYRVGFGRRLGAALIDLIIVIAIMLLVFFLTGFFNAYIEFVENVKAVGNNQQEIVNMWEDFFSSNAYNFYFLYLFGLVYYSLEILVGASLGKMITNIQIAGTDRKKASTSALFSRYLIKNSSSLIGILWLATQVIALNQIGSLVGFIILVGFFFTLSRKRQAFHDMIPKTAVYHKNDIIQEEITI